jgi:hypothetical protein
MAGADGRRGLTSSRAHGALLAGGPARRGRDARARPAPLAAAPPRATDVRPPAPPACRQTCAPTCGPRRRARRDARRSGAPTDPGCAMLQAQPDRLRVESSTDAFVCASWEVWVPAARRTCFWAKAVTRVVPRDRPSDCPVVRMVSVEGSRVHLATARDPGAASSTRQTTHKPRREALDTVQRRRRPRVRRRAGTLERCPRERKSTKPPLSAKTKVEVSSLVAPVEASR